MLNSPTYQTVNTTSVLSPPRKFQLPHCKKKNTTFVSVKTKPTTREVTLGSSVPDISVSENKAQMIKHALHLE